MAQQSSVVASIAATPPGVYVDKQTSLLLAPPTESLPSRATAMSINTNNINTPPSCQYQNEYLEEDMNTLLSDWMEYDMQGSSSNSISDGDSVDNVEGERNTDTPKSTTANESTPTPPQKDNKKDTTKKKKKKKIRLQWRPPGMQKPKKSRARTRSASPLPKGSSSTSRNSKRDSAPSKSRLPPSSSLTKSSSSLRSNKRNNSTKQKKKKKSNKASFDDDSIAGASISTFRSLTTFRSSASTIFTTKSSATAKASNKANSRNKRSSMRGNDPPGSVKGGSSIIMTSGSSSVLDTVGESKPHFDTRPPLSSYRRRRRRATALAEAQKKSDNPSDSNQTLPQNVQSSTSYSFAQTMAVLNEQAALEEQYNADNGIANNANDDKTHVSFGNVKIKVTKNYESEEGEGNCSGEGILDNMCIPSDEAQATLVKDFSEIVMGGVQCSPTSVRKFQDDDEGERSIGEFAKVNGSIDEQLSPRKLSMGSGESTAPLTAETTIGDDDTVATINSNERRPGPIDIDTCTRHLTSTERRHLRAMHELGHKQLQNANYVQAIEVFSEILRGQKERHGKRSSQCAVAMHNLGVVCMKCNKYIETVRLCDGAARIRVEKLGQDHLDVASSLSQQGVALMELKEFPLALASFREALRIRTKAWTNGWGLENSVNHPLIVRLLNNIGCALFEMNELDESQVTFENALAMQRELMKMKKSQAVKKEAGDDKDIDPKDSYHAPLSIALTLTNLGSIHLRLSEFDKSLVYFEEAVLIQESVLGENHKIVMNTKESISFVLQSQEKQKISSKSVDRIGGILPTYEESKKMYNKVQNDISAVLDAVSSSTACGSQPICVGDDQEKK